LNAARDKVGFNELSSSEWDLLIIGGGITGAGVFREAAAAGWRTLLVERGDFASGTSSKSSKLVHGGLHYLMRRQVRLTRQCLRDRNRLLRDEAGLVESLSMLIPRHPSEPMPSWFVSAGLDFYDLLGGRFAHHQLLSPQQLSGSLPFLDPGTAGGFRYCDARTDDARLVLSVLRQGTRLGGKALNYTSAESLLRRRDGHVIGAVLLHVPTGQTCEVRARAVVNATGPWIDQWATQPGHPVGVRLVRGSHLIFDRARLPIDQGIAARHPTTRQPLYLVPWEGAIVAGSTSVEQSASAEREPRIDGSELDQLLAGVQMLVPGLCLTAEDVRATFSGVRLIVDAHMRDPSRASRELVVWNAHGVLNVAGGKMTTFQSTARAVMRRLRRLHPALPETRFPGKAHEVDGVHSLEMGDHQDVSRLIGRYGWEGACEIVNTDSGSRTSGLAGDLGTTELRWIVRNEQVVNLDDLLLRRVRIGLTDPEWLPANQGTVREVVQSELGWSDDEWQRQTSRYGSIWSRFHSPA